MYLSVENRRLSRGSVALTVECIKLLSIAFDLSMVHLNTQLYLFPVTPHLLGALYCTVATLKLTHLSIYTPYCNSLLHLFSECIHPSTLSVCGTAAIQAGRL